jgi:hypothetical protein
MVPDGKGNCAKPPYLPSADCQAGSRIGKQPTDAKIAIVWLCRKKAITDRNSPDFDDIAVIQTNFENGATCWYQKLPVGTETGFDGRNVPAPKTNTGNFWFQPADTEKQKCGACHDTGFIRTPYLKQTNVLPLRRHRDRYWFPGADFASWNGRVKRIVDEAAQPNCTSCHPMGANTIMPKLGSSTWLGLMAAGETETHLLTPSKDYGQHAFWMSPTAAKDGHPIDEDKADAARMSACALGTKDKCRLEDWPGQIQAILDDLAERPLPARAQPTQRRLQPER